MSLVILLCVAIILSLNIDNIRAAYILHTKYGISYSGFLGLSDREKDFSNKIRDPREVEFIKENSDWFVQSVDKSIPNVFRYDHNNIDKSMPTLAINVEYSDGIYPKIFLSGAKTTPVGKFLNFYVEVDTSPDFNSSHLWRWPQLRPNFGDVFQWNLVSSAGVNLDLHNSSHRKIDTPNVNAIVFPFCLLAMSVKLPKDRRELQFSDFTKQARALTYGLTGFSAINEVFQYAKHSYIWGGDTKQKRPIDVFVSGTAACGNLNNLTGSMLEINGYRYRLVAGFYPDMRPYIPGGGHSAIEIYNKDLDTWSFVDNYLDVALNGISAEDFQTHKFGQTLRHKREREGKHWNVTFANLFKYRYYGDKTSRLPLMPMTKLSGREKEYGLHWKLREVTEKFDPFVDLKQKFQVFVRARYAYSNCEIRYLNSKAVKCKPVGVRLSEWNVISFEVDTAKILNRLNLNTTR